MLSKCANPECSEVFRYLHQGKIFLLSPTPEVQMATENACPSLYERFWLCDRCSKLMTVVWAGTGAKLVSLPSATAPGPSSLPPAPERAFGNDVRNRLRGRAASAGPDDG
jgi:hypothetical protein